MRGAHASRTRAWSLWYDSIHANGDEDGKARQGPVSSRAAGAALVARAAAAAAFARKQQGAAAAAARRTVRGVSGKPSVGDAVQMRMAGQTWWRGTVRAERQRASCLTTCGTSKREADTQLLLQPVEDPNERKRKPGAARGARWAHVRAVRAGGTRRRGGGGPSSSAAAESGADQTAVGGEVVDDLQLGSVAAVREWMLVTKATGATAAADAAQAAERRRGERSSTRATAGTAASFTAGGGDGDNDDDDEEADATDGRNRASGELDGQSQGVEEAARQGARAAGQGAAEARSPHAPAWRAARGASGRRIVVTYERTRRRR